MNDRVRRPRTLLWPHSRNLSDRTILRKHDSYGPSCFLPAKQRHVRILLFAASELESHVRFEPGSRQVPYSGWVPYRTPQLTSSYGRSKFQSSIRDLIPRCETFQGFWRLWGAFRRREFGSPQGPWVLSLPRRTRLVAAGIKPPLLLGSPPRYSHR